MSDSVFNAPRRPRLTDVAHAAGVSVATASYVLSNRAGVTISPATRQRVSQAAEKLGYRRNALAAALRSGGNREIGLFIPARPFGVLADVVFALAEAATSRQFSPFIHIGDKSSFDPGRYEGVVSLGPLSLGDASVGLDRPPIVEIGSNAGACQIHFDDFGGSRRGVEHLLSLGHRRIAHFAGPQTEPGAQERLRGFLDAVHEAGLRMDATPVVHSLAEFAGILGTASRPSAVLARDDPGAAAIYACARECGLRVASELSIVGFGDESIAKLLDPPLTTIRVAPELVAGTALALLERQLAHEVVPAQTLIPTALVVRESTAAPD